MISILLVEDDTNTRKEFIEYIEEEKHIPYCHNQRFRESNRSCNNLPDTII